MKCGSGSAMGRLKKAGKMKSGGAVKKKMGGGKVKKMMGGGMSKQGLGSIAKAAAKNRMG